MGKSSTKQYKNVFSLFFFYSLLRLKQKRRITKSSRKPNTVREKNQWSFRWISGLVRTTRESSRGRCGGVFREQSTKKGRKKSEKKKTKSVSKIKEHLHAPLCGVAMVLGRFPPRFSPRWTPSSRYKICISGKKMEEG